PGSVMFLQIAGKQKLIPVLGKGIFEITGHSKVMEWEGGAFFKDMVVTRISRISNDIYLIATRDHGMYTNNRGQVIAWNKKYTELFKKMQINRMVITKNKQIVLGTINDGIYIFSPEVTMVYHLHAGNGLNNNTVLSMYENKEGDIWVGLDKGIAKIHLAGKNLAFKDAYNTIGSVYTAAIHNQTMYLGTNQGMYRYHNKDDNFQII